jgi:hypothetical protein
MQIVRRPLVLAALLPLLAACGSSGHGSLAPSAAGRLAAESDAVAAKLQAGDGCGAAALARRLHRNVVAAGLPAEARASAAGLAAEIVCVPPAPPVMQPTVTQPAVTQPAPAPPEDGNGKHEDKPKHGHKHGHGDQGG